MELLRIDQLDIGEMYISDRNAHVFRKANAADRIIPMVEHLSLYLGTVPFDSISMEKRENFMYRLHDHRVARSSTVVEPEIVQPPAQFHKFLFKGEIYLAHNILKECCTYMLKDYA